MGWDGKKGVGCVGKGWDGTQLTWIQISLEPDAILIAPFNIGGKPSVQWRRLMQVLTPTLVVIPEYPTRAYRALLVQFLCESTFELHFCNVCEDFSFKGHRVGLQHPVRGFPELSPPADGEHAVNEMVQTVQTVSESMLCMCMCMCWHSGQRLLHRCNALAQ